MAGGPAAFFGYWTEAYLKSRGIGKLSPDEHESPGPLTLDDHPADASRRPRGIIALVLLVGALALTACSGPPPGTPLLAQSVPRSGTIGPLTILPSNPRYFTDREGRRAVYLTGSHTWNSIQDWDVSDRPRPFDYDAYLA